MVFLFFLLLLIRWLLLYTSCVPGAPTLLVKFRLLITTTKKSIAVRIDSSFVFCLC